MADLDGEQLLAEVENTWPKLGILLRTKFQTAVNAVAQAAGVAAVGQVAAPSSPQAVSVAVAGEMMHVAIADNAPLQRNIRYFTEVANNPSFSQPIVIDHGASRTSHPFPLPTMDADGNTQSWFVRSYSQYPGSQPSKPVVFGGNNPTALTMAGTTRLTLLPSTGSGTAANNGQQGASGLGKVLLRPATGPKRQVGQ
jgi:hypothetical protein